MSNWTPYAPDFNPPPGIPKGYPNALNPSAPTMNPLHPNLQMNPNNSSGFYPTIGLNPPQATPAGSSPYPSAGSSPYPSAGSSPYPAAGSSPYPAAGSSPYPAAGSPYPSAGSSPYPAAGSSPYPAAGSSPYPAAGSSPYPGAGSSPYPSGGNSYPSGGSSPYSSTGSSPYPPATGSPAYPSSTGSSYYPPSAGSSPYPPSAGSSPYPPSAGSSPYPPSAGSSPNPPNAGSYKTPSYPTAGVSPYPKTTSAQFNPNSPYSNNQTNFNRGHPSGHCRSNMAEYITGEGTVKPYPNFDPKVDAEILRKAMKGFGTDEKAIINVLANRSNAQRVYISIAFKQLYGKDLIDDLKSELSGNFETIILGLMMPLNDYLASELHKAISGIGTDEDVLIEVLCTRTNQEIWSINEAYQRLYGKNLEDDIKSDTSGHFQRLLVSSCTGARSEAPADGMRAKETADALYQAGAAQWGTDESTFNAILVSESFQQLAYTFYEYEKLAGTTVTQAIKNEMSGDLKKGMLAIAKCVENRPFYFAERLYKAMKVGLGTDDNTLIRIVVSRCEIDMVQIKAEYERNYEKPLVDAISGDTSGDYKKILIALVNGN